MAPALTSFWAIWESCNSRSPIIAPGTFEISPVESNLTFNGTSLSIDGVTVLDGDRVLIKDQTDKSENGIYVVEGVGVDIAFTRSEDADGVDGDGVPNDEVSQGLAVDVVNGTLNGRTRWLLTTSDPITVDTTQLTFVEVPNPSTLVQFKDEQFELDVTDISNGYVDLSNDAETGSVFVFPEDGPMQVYGTDYTLSLVSNVTRVTFANDLSTLLASGDNLVVKYAHYS